MEKISTFETNRNIHCDVNKIHIENDWFCQEIRKSSDSINWTILLNASILGMTEDSWKLYRTNASNEQPAIIIIHFIFNQ